MNIITEATTTLIEATQKGATFITFLYKTKGTGETAKYLVNFGIDNKTACQHDLDAVLSYQPTSLLEEEAKEEIVTSLRQTLTKGVSDSYTQKDTFETIGRGLHKHKETGEIYINGFVESKEQVEPPTNPKATPNSSAKTLAKRHIERICKFKRNKFGKFILSPENIGGIKVKGDLIELHP